ncbi:MAG: type II toxin-antitoxin system VapC family toxin [bacterium]|nr:type II toxin-antitoxin system VapC family toxin [bacterium]
MNGVLVDSSVILDLFSNDPSWAAWSETALERCGANNPLYINPIIYAEVSIGFHQIEPFETALLGCDLKLAPVPREALFLAGKAFVQYRKRKGARTSPLPDFFIGAHAAVAQFPLLTRDPARIKAYFPTVALICPEERGT